MARTEKRPSREDAIFAISWMEKNYHPYRSDWRYGINLELLKQQLVERGYDPFSVCVEIFENVRAYGRRWEHLAFAWLGVMVALGEVNDDQVRKYWELVREAAEEDAEEFTRGVHNISGHRNGADLLIGIAYEFLDGNSFWELDSYRYQVAYIVSTALPLATSDALTPSFLRKLERVLGADERYALLIERVKEKIG